MKLLQLRNGEDEVRRVCGDESTALHVAVAQGNAEAVMVLLKFGAAVNAQNKDGNTALHLCSKFKNMDVARLLLAAGAKIALPNANGHTAMYAAKHYKNNELQKLLSKIKNKEVPRGSLDELLRSPRYEALHELLSKAEEEEVKEMPVPETEMNREEEVPLEEKHEVSEEVEPVSMKVEVPIPEDEEEEEVDAAALQQLWETIQALNARIENLSLEGRETEAPTQPQSLEAATTMLNQMMERVSALDEQTIQQEAQTQEPKVVEVKEDNDLAGTACEICGSASGISVCPECHHAFCHVCTSSNEHLNFHLDQYF